MKRIILMLCIVLVPIISWSQTPEKILVNKSDLPPELVKQIEIENQVKNITKYTGIGKEVGIAVKDGLTAVKDVAIEFSDTDVGTFTMVLIAWKLMGVDAIRIVIGLLIFIVTTFVVVFGLKRTAFPRKYILEDPGWFKYPKKYQLIAGDVDYAWGWLVVFIVMFILCGVLMFA